MGGCSGCRAQRTCRAASLAMLPAPGPAPSGGMRGTRNTQSSSADELVIAYLTGSCRLATPVTVILHHATRRLHSSTGIRYSCRARAKRCTTFRVPSASTLLYCRPCAHRHRIGPATLLPGSKCTVTRRAQAFCPGKKFRIGCLCSRLHLSWF
jgi:hypothetical protein